MSRKAIILISVIVVTVLAFFALRHFLFKPTTSISQTLTQSGFVELRPPSTLVPPGTWVSVLSTNPLHLSIVCTSENALGQLDTIQLRNSTSAEADMIAKLTGSYDIGAEVLRKVKTSLKFEEVENITFQLKNIRVIELPDDVVMKRLRNREKYCWDAIRFRIDGKEKVSMVKSVLIADVDYKVDFSRKLNNQTEANLKKELALEMDLKLSAGQDGTTKLVGKGLIWGIREDARLAIAGLDLPATGGEGDVPDVLKGQGSVIEISPAKPVRRVLQDSVIAFDVEPIRQNSLMSCWATVYTMMKSWKDKTPLSVKSVVTGLGSPWDEYYVEDKGLPGGKEKEFVALTKMESKPPASYTIEAYRDMLKSYGPLWIITGNGISSHARLLIGIYGNPDAGGIEAYEETTLEFIDPLLGTYTYENALDFTKNFESEARWLVDGKLDHIRFRDQILHWPASE